MNVADVHARACAAGFSEFADELAALALPAFTLEPDATGSDVGHLGGLPRLPAGVPWPMSRWATVEPRPLAFVAEIDLASLDPSIWPGPAAGTLVFFCDIDVDALFVDSGGAALVQHIPPDVALAPVKLPEQLHKDLRYRELRVAARPVMTVPFGASEPELLKLGLDADATRYEAYHRMRAELVGVDTHWTAQHQLLGWPPADEDELHATWPRLHDEAIDFGLSTPAPAPESWRLLLQISSDYDRIGTQFGDGGSLLFAVPDADLAAGRFDRVQAITDSL